MDDLDKIPKEGYGFIYRYTFENGMCYIGQTKNSVQSRAYMHSHCNSKSIVDKAIRSGMKFDLEIIAEVPCDMLDRVERYCISYFSTIYPRGYNLVLGGQTYRDYSPEVCRKISESNKGRTVWNKGKTPNKEQIKGLLDYISSHSQKGANNHFYGKNHSQESKNRMSESRIRFYKENPERLEEMRLRNKQFVIKHPEYREEQRQLQRKLKIEEGMAHPILCIETNIRYDSIMEASRMTGICNSSICEAVNGKRKTAGGFHWKSVKREKY